ncbi:MAG TPA: tail fiber protein [Allosphingosinicella sp.]|jgi:microcystin-dependent protein
MADPFVAEIRIFGFNFAPTGWAFCNGQIMPISQNTALFSLLGVTYGGDGKSTFALPNMAGNVPMQPGQGSGLSPRNLGEMSGSETVTLLQSEMPAHNHFAQATTTTANTDQPAGASIARGQFSFQGNSGAAPLFFTGAPDTVMAPQAIGVAGGSLPHNNMQPYLTLNFCIALQGVFPPRQ